MMASFMSYFGARKDSKQASRDAIVTLRQQLQMIEKKEDYLQKKIEEETKKAKQNAVSNKAGGCRRLRLVSLSCPWLSQGLGYGCCSGSPGSSSALSLMSVLMW